MRAGWRGARTSRSGCKTTIAASLSRALLHPDAARPSRRGRRRPWAASRGTRSHLDFTPLASEIATAVQENRCHDTTHDATATVQQGRRAPVHARHAPHRSRHARAAAAARSDQLPQIALVTGGGWNRPRRRRRWRPPARRCVSSAAASLAGRRGDTAGSIVFTASTSRRRGGAIARVDDRPRAAARPQARRARAEPGACPTDSSARAKATSALLDQLSHVLAPRRGLAWENGRHGVIVNVVSAECTCSSSAATGCARSTGGGRLRRRARVLRDAPRPRLADQAMGRAPPACASRRSIPGGWRRRASGTRRQWRASTR